MSATDITPAQQQFAAALEGKVNSMLQLDGTFDFMSVPQGFFCFTQLPPNNYTNANAIGVMDTACITGSNGVLTLGADLISAQYARVLGATQFVISHNDQAVINQQMSAYATQVSAVISNWESEVGPITPAQMASAVPPTKLGYIEHQVQAQWKGDISTIPSSMALFAGAYQAYQNDAKAMNALMVRAAQAQTELAAALTATQNPSAANGGLQTGDSSWVAAYEGFSQANISNGLATAGNTIALSLELSNFSSETVSLGVSGNASLLVPILDILDFSLKGSASYGLNKYVESDTTVSVSIEYAGVTPVACAPAPLDPSWTTGWFDGQLLAEVVANAGAAPGSVTGFQLQGSEIDPTTFFGPGHAFGRIKTFVISQQPTVSMTFTGGDVASLETDLKAGVSASLNILGLFSIGGASANYEVKDVTSSSEAGTVTATFGAPTQVGSLVPATATAFVLGGVASYPPVAP